MDQMPSPSTPESSLYIPPASTSGKVPPKPAQKKSRKGMLIGLFVSLIVVIGLGSTYAAARFGYITLPIPLPGVPNDIIVKSLDALYNTTASETVSEFSIKISPRDSSIPTFFPTTTAPTSNSNGFGLGTSTFGSVGTMMDLIPDNLAISGSSAGYSEKTTGAGKVDGSFKLSAVVGETNVDADIELRLLEENIFLKINALTGVPNIDASKVAGKWFTTTVAEASELVPTETNADADKALKESRQTIEQILELAQKHQLFTTKKKFGTEVIEGVNTRHTSHTFDAKKVVPFLEDLIATRKKTGQDVNGADTMLAEIRKDENQTRLDNFSKALTVDLWYDGKVKLMKKIGITMVIVPPAESVKYKDSQFVLAFATTIKSAGVIQSIETPTEAEPLETLVGSLLTGSSTELETSKTLADNFNELDLNLNTNSEISADSTLNSNTALNLDTDGDTISDELETVLYLSDPTKVDSDGDGLDDGEEALGWTTSIDPQSVDNSAVFVTSMTKADTDGDGYSDRDELCNGYNPTGSGAILIPLSRRPKVCP